jgi:uncharacterized membrane protein
MRACLLLLALLITAAEPTVPVLATVHSPEGVRLFNERIQPALAQHCHECHAGAKRRGGLQVDSLDKLLAGGHDFGPAIIPFDIKHSSLLMSIRYEGDSDLNMPPKYKLDDALIADFERWVALGAPWPQEAAAVPLPPPPAKPPVAGRLHPIVVHLPIAALALAVVAELLVLWLGAAWTPVTGFLTVFGTLGAIGAVISGTLLAGNQDPQLLERHELLGWLSLCGGAISTVVIILQHRLGFARGWVLPTLLVTAALVGLTGHVGGQMSWGSDWLPF